MKRQHFLKLILGAVAFILCCLVLRRFLNQGRIQVPLGYVMLQGSLVGWAALILTAALSSGCALLRWLRLRPKRPAAVALFGVGLGLGLLSTLTLILGSAGLCDPSLLTLLLIVLFLVGLRDLMRLLGEMAPGLARARRASAFRIALWCVLGLFLLMNLTRAFEPPWHYDSLEYHVGAPAAYHRANRVFFIRDNVYANFPQNVEILYFLGMQLTGSPDDGATVGQLLGAALGFLAALALRSMLAGLAGRETGDIAAAFFYTWPGVTLYSGMAYVELPLIFYATLALWGLLWSWRRRRTAPGSRNWVVLAGIAAGLAIGVKYTAVLLILVPVAICLIALGLLSGIARREIARRLVWFAATAILVCSPWLIRNTVNTRNPVYPLLYNVFGGTNWDAQKDARWTQAHSPGSYKLERLVQRSTDVLFVNQNKASLLLLLFIPFVLLCGMRTRAIAALLAAHAFLLLLLWLFFAQHNERLLDIIVPVLAALSALGLAALLQLHRAMVLRPLAIVAAVLRPLTVVLLLLAPSRWVNYLNVERSLPVALGAVSQDQYFAGPAGIDYKPNYAAMKYINDPDSLPPGSKILLLGEAQTFYCRRDHIASTVFDRNVLEEIVARSETPEDIRDQLKTAGVTHLFVDAFHLSRLQKSYRYQYEDREYLGMLDEFNWPLFGRFVKTHLVHLGTVAASSAENFPWEKWNHVRENDPKRTDFRVIYALR